MTELILGPNGGLVALGFGAGAVSGWGFAMKTALAGAMNRVNELKEENRIMRDQLEEARQRYLAKLEGE